MLILPFVLLSFLSFAVASWLRRVSSPVTSNTNLWSLYFNLSTELAYDSCWLVY